MNFASAYSLPKNPLQLRHKTVGGYQEWFVWSGIMLVNETHMT